jgi:hypothetical protein
MAYHACILQRDVKADITWVCKTKNLEVVAWSSNIYNYKKFSVAFQQIICIHVEIFQFAFFLASQSVRVQNQEYSNFCTVIFLYRLIS